MSFDADVIIVGAGPSGLTLAAELARNGINILVLERRDEQVESRAGTLLPRVLEHFDTRGIAEQFIKKTAEIQRNPLRPLMTIPPVCNRQICPI